MSSQVNHYDKKTGNTYVYEVKSYWDKEKKSSRNRQVYLGRLDETTGTIVPSSRNKKATGQPTESNNIVNLRVCGPNILLSRLDEELGIGKLARRYFPEIADEMMSLVYFLAQKGLPLSRSEFWSMNHQHPFDKTIKSQRVSELLKAMDESSRQEFCSKWASVMLENDYLCYDITSVSSYSESNEYVKVGYNRDKENLPQINLAMLFGQKSKLPIYYRRLPGSISDVSTLKTTLKVLNYLGLGLNSIQMVMDRGFYSIANIDDIFSHRIHFIIGVPTSRKWVEDIIDKYYENVTSPENYYITGEEEALFAVTHLYRWGDKKRRCYLHLYYNAERAALDYDKLTRTLKECKDELELDKPIPKHQEMYNRFFIVTETPKRGKKIEYNNDEIQKCRKRYAGFFCILSSKLKNAIEVLDIYRTKDIVENSFDDLKNSLDMKRLRVHTSAAMDSRLFLQFLATIFVCKIRETIHNQTDSTIKYLSVREVMEAMESLSVLSNKHKYKGVLSELTVVQKKLAIAFGLNVLQI
ncbi:IS4 family transposase [Clostridia bacterium]|nr:IS4 family transposase [Clostridia bacterium]